MLLIKNGLLVTNDRQNSIIENGAVLMDGNKVSQIGNSADLEQSFPDCETIDASGRIIMPGLVNLHMHTYGLYARGISLNTPPAEDFIQILQRLWWTLDKALTPEGVYYSALVMFIECIKNGVTTVFDHHASPTCVRGSLFSILEAARKAKLRSCLCYEVSDRDGERVCDEGIRENVDFINAAKSMSDTAGMFGMHSLLTLSDRTLEKCARENPAGSGFHIHVAEGKGELYDNLLHYNMRPVERLDKFGILNDRTFAGHCIYINESEMDTIRERGTVVLHNPQSNMGNAVGCQNLMKLFEKNVQVALGTDGYTADMFESMKTVNILHKHQNADPRVAWGEPIQMLMNNNPDIASRYYDVPVGRLMPGYAADAIIVDYFAPTPLNGNTLGGHMHFGMSGKSVSTVVSNGEVVMKERQLLLGLDEAEIAAKSREEAVRVWNRL